MENFFTKIYENNTWGNNRNGHYSGSSGAGSFVNNTWEYIKIVRNFINEHKISKIVDLGCGDFQIGMSLYDDLDVSYTGYDVYKKVIDYHVSQYPKPKYTFKHLDIYGDKHSIVEGDMCILKDVLQHWTINEIYTFMDYLIKSKKFKYILISNCCNQKSDDQDEPFRSRPLSCDFLPLKKYNPIKIANFTGGSIKEASVIKL